MMKITATTDMIAQMSVAYLVGFATVGSSSSWDRVPAVFGAVAPYRSWNPPCACGESEPRRCENRQTPDAILSPAPAASDLLPPHPGGTLLT
jgi:hypothetical protein